MAFTVPSIKVFGTEVSEPNTKRFIQTVQFNIVGTIGDVVLDLGNTTFGSLGIFWASVGEGDPSLNIWRRIQAKGDSILSIHCPQIQDTKAKVASGAAVATGQFKSTTTPATLTFTLFAGEGLTAYTLNVQVLLKAGAFPEDNNPN